jgi:hypothetical protein
MLGGNVRGCTRAGPLSNDHAHDKKRCRVSAGAGCVRPPETYAIKTDEKGLSFLAYRRIATTIALSVRYESTFARAGGHDRSCGYGRCLGIRGRLQNHVEQGGYEPWAYLREESIYVDAQMIGTS